MAPVGQCKLCGATGPLRDSHIFPDFLIRALERKVPKGTGGLQPTSILLSTRPEIDGGQKQRGYWENKVGMKEYLLCQGCEGVFSNYERYFREFFYGKSPATLTKRAIGTVLPVPGDGIKDGWTEAREVIADYRQLKLFVLSILWRSSVATGYFFNRISLDVHEPIIKSMLLQAAPGADSLYPIVITDLRFSTTPSQELIQQPDFQEENGQRDYVFVFGGFMIFVHVGDGRPLPKPIPQISLKESGKFTMLVAEADHMLQSWGAALKANGKI